MNIDELVLWIWLSLCYSSHNTTLKRLIEHFGNPTRIYEASEEEYKVVTRHPEPLMNKSLDRVMEIVEYIIRNDVGIITYNDPRYPKRLKALDNCPMLLYYVGTLYDFDNTPSIGVVGTRRYTIQGERVTKRIAYDLSRSGFSIVSGLAKGIDSFAHKAALYNKGMTTAVLGCGIDVIYPSENEELTLRIHENGLVITEFAPGTSPASWNFPARNRIISALSDGIFVTECTLKSGTIITADHAFKHNIPVYMHKNLCSDAEGYLKERGAVSILTADEITSDYKKKYPHLMLVSELEPEEKLKPDEYTVTAKPLPKFIPGKTSSTAHSIPHETAEETVTPIKKEVQQKDISLLSMEEQAILKRLGDKSRCIDELIDESVSMSELLRLLTSLEIKGYIISQAGGKYAANID